MKLRYYLRGLGIGILMTVVILTIAGAGKETMTDEEIKARAKELGMVESTVLSGMETSSATGGMEEHTTPSPSEVPEEEVIPEPSEVPEEEVTPEPSEVPKEEVTPAPLEEPKATVTPAPSEEPKETVVPEPSEGSENSTITVKIVISAGDSSVSVSKDLEAAGLVESASAYDKYLCDNGYDRKIRVGAYEIPVGATDEEIALIITGKR